MSDSNPAKAYTSAQERLMGLSAIFTGSDLTVRFGWTSTSASQYLSQWRKRGLVQSLGGVSDVHFNLLQCSTPNLEAGLRRAIPKAVKGGVDVLREAGWTTQVLRHLEAIVPSNGPVYSLNGVSLQTRKPQWFELTESGTIPVDPQEGLRRLHPAWALADMIHRARDRRVGDAWLLDPDDIDLEAAREDKRMGKALLQFRLQPSVISDEGYAALYDDWRERTYASEEQGESGDVQLESPAP